MLKLQDFHLRQDYVGNFSCLPSRLVSARIQGNTKGTLRAQQTQHQGVGAALTPYTPYIRPSWERKREKLTLLKLRAVGTFVVPPL